MMKRTIIWMILVAIGWMGASIPSRAQYTVSVAEQQNCTVTVSPQKETYAKGDLLTVTLTPTSGAIFDRFEVYYECTEAEYWEAWSSAAKPHPFMAKARKKSPRRSNSRFAYRLEIWFLDENDPVEVTEGSEYTFTMPARNVEIEAVFMSNETNYPITTKASEHGTTTVDKSQAAVAETVTITTQPADGYMVDEVKVIERENDGTAIYESLLPFSNVDGVHFTFEMPANPVRVEVTYTEGLSLSDNADNSQLITRHDGLLASKVVLCGRTLYQNGSWQTLCLPFNLSNFTGTPLEGAVVKELVSSELDNTTGTLTLTFGDDLTAIEAGKPYIVKWATEEGAESTEVVDPVFQGVTIRDVNNPFESEAVNFCGVYSPITFTANSKSVLYLNNENHLLQPDGDVTLNACRAYFEVPALGTLKGDVDKNGQVNVNDVTALVDIILGKDNTQPYVYDHQAADVDGSGSVAIGDVTLLVNIILGKYSAEQDVKSVVSNVGIGM